MGADGTGLVSAMGTETLNAIATHLMSCHVAATEERRGVGERGGGFIPAHSSRLHPSWEGGPGAEAQGILPHHTPTLAKCWPLRSASGLPFM